jgi:hypothetical protein
MAVTWTNDNCKHIVKHIETMWYDGISTSAIATTISNRYGLVVSKNAIVGLRTRMKWIARPSCIRRYPPGLERPISQPKTIAPPPPPVFKLPPLPSLSPEPVRALATTQSSGPTAIIEAPAWVTPVPSKKKIVAVVVCEVVAPQHQETAPAPRVAKSLPVRRSDGSGCMWVIGKSIYCDADLCRVQRPHTTFLTLASYCGAHEKLAYLPRKEVRN